MVVIFISGLQLAAWRSNDAEMSQWPPIWNKECAQLCAYLKVSYFCDCNKELNKKSENDDMCCTSSDADDNEMTFHLGWNVLPITCGFEVLLFAWWRLQFCDIVQFGSLLSKFWGSLMFLDKREATSFSRTLVTNYQSTLCYIPDNLIPAWKFQFSTTNQEK